MDLPLLAIAATLAPLQGALTGAAVGAVGARGRRPAAALLLALSLLAFAGAAALVAPSGSRLGGGAAVLGLVLAGAALAGFRPVSALGRALPLLCVAALLDGAPTGWGVLAARPPFAVATTATLLDASPRVLVMESAGADWLRHPMVYGPAGADRIGPDRRAPYRATVAGGGVLLLGCILLALRLLWSAARERSSTPWQPDASSALFRRRSSANR